MLILIKRPVKTLLLWGILALMIFFNGCLSEISLDAPVVNPESIAIRGVVKSGDTASVVVKVTNVVNFRAFEIPEVIQGARVTVTDESGNTLEVPLQDNGNYELFFPEGNPNFQIAPGKSYQLSVGLPDGRQYQSAFESLEPVPKPDTLTFTVESREFGNEIGNIVVKEYLDVRIKTPIIKPDGNGKARFKWSMRGVFQFSEPPDFTAGVPVPSPKVCYSYEDVNLDKVIIFNGSSSLQDTLDDFQILEKFMDYRFHEGYYLTVFQQSLSPDAYRYWEEIQSLVNVDGTVYDPPPGKIKGNIRNVDDETEEVFGFFYATEERLIRRYIPRGMTSSGRFCPHRITIENLWETQRQCFDCRLRPGSTYDKPDFWEY